MSTIRVTKEFRFEAAHALTGYDGVCRNIHGHSYELSVTVIGKPIPRNDSPKRGMVIDFNDLKKIVKKEIVDLFDHALILGSDFTKNDLRETGEPFGNIVLVDYQPTIENILTDIADRLKTLLPQGIKLFSLKLRETANSFAEWYSEDNETQ
jgi:6-pyruvoyltetrahydropterin/6-carboxytetrahydropterin synthase